MNKLYMNKSIYEIKFIRNAIKDYANIANIDILESDTYFEIIFRESIFDMSVTIKEFENYIISIMNSKEMNR